MATLGASDTLVLESDIKKLDGLAIDYVIERSRLGSNVLRCRWSTARNPKFRKANAYFALAPVPGRWRDVCDQLSNIPVQSERAGVVIQDTKGLVRRTSRAPVFHRERQNYRTAGSAKAVRIVSAIPEKVRPCRVRTPVDSRSRIAVLSLSSIPGPGVRRTTALIRPA